jgi:hypothetical protein
MSLSEEWPRAADFHELTMKLLAAERKVERLRETLRAVLLEPDPVKRNQIAASVLQDS